MNRRQLLGSFVASSAYEIFPAFGQAPVEEMSIVSTLPPLPADLADKATLPPAPYAETAQVGTAPPTTNEIDKAYDILVNSPTGGTPIDVAQYFLSVGAGAYGDEYRPFAREWPVRANPLIFQFFS